MGEKTQLSKVLNPLNPESWLQLPSTILSKFSKNILNQKQTTQLQGSSLAGFRLCKV